MNQDKANAILNDIRAAIREIEKKHGLVPSRITGNWNSDGGVKTNITMMEASAEGAAAAKDAGLRTDPKQLDHLRKHGWKFGLEISDIGKEFKIGSTVYEFSGMSSSQYAVGRKKSDGKYYRLNPRDVKLGFGK